MTVSPGDSYTGQVTYSSARFVLKLTDNSTGASFQTTQTAAKAKRTSVEWIMEGPPSGSLSDFGSVPFSAASGTISGQSAALGAFSNADPITMTTSSGIVRAVPSSVTGGASFTVSWKHA
jgi:hypothetical protein